MFLTLVTQPVRLLVSSATYAVVVGENLAQVPNLRIGGLGAFLKNWQRFSKIHTTTSLRKWKRSAVLLRRAYRAYVDVLSKLKLSIIFEAVGQSQLLRQQQYEPKQEGGGGGSRYLLLLGCCCCPKAYSFEAVDFPLLRLHLASRSAIRVAAVAAAAAAALSEVGFSPCC